MALADLPRNPTREDLEDHVVELCVGGCVGDPQLLADLDDLDDEELRGYIDGVHAYHAARAHPSTT